MEPFIGQIIQAGFSYAPYGWALCSGQLMPINQYLALYALLGTNFGGNGITDFALPNAQGRTLIGSSSIYGIGTVGGAETVTLTNANLPTHNHTAQFHGTASSPSVTGSLTAKAGASPTSNEPTAGASLTTVNNVGSQSVRIYAPAGSGGTDVTLAGVNIASAAVTPSGTIVVGQTGMGQAVANMQPYLAVTTIIALQGVYPIHQ